MKDIVAREMAIAGCLFALGNRKLGWFFYAIGTFLMIAEFFSD